MLGTFFDDPYVRKKASDINEVMEDARTLWSESNSLDGYRSVVSRLNKVQETRAELLYSVLHIVFMEAVRDAHPVLFLRMLVDFIEVCFRNMHMASKSTVAIRQHVANAVNEPDERCCGLRPLQYAVNNRHQAAILLLVECGADVNVGADMAFSVDEERTEYLYTHRHLTPLQLFIEEATFGDAFAGGDFEPGGRRGPESPRLRVEVLDALLTSPAITPAMRAQIAEQLGRAGHPDLARAVKWFGSLRQVWIDAVVKGQQRTTAQWRTRAVLPYTGFSVSGAGAGAGSHADNGSRAIVTFKRRRAGAGVSEGGVRYRGRYAKPCRIRTSLWSSRSRSRTYTRCSASKRRCKRS
jgi:hypothetical protein